jgi:hypothetical protein
MLRVNLTRDPSNRESFPLPYLLINQCSNAAYKTLGGSTGSCYAALGLHIAGNPDTILFAVCRCVCV